MREILWNWVVVGAIVLLLAGGGISFMTSPYTLVADGFFAASAILFLSKFVTWEEAHAQVGGRSKAISIGVAITLILLIIAIGGNHLLHRGSNNVAASLTPRPSPPRDTSPSRDKSPPRTIPAPAPTPLESQAYPWISWIRYSNISESGLEVFVTLGAYPELSSDSVQPYLSRIHETVAIPMYINPKQDGWWSCLIYNGDEPWLRAGDEFNKPAQTVSWGPTHNIQIEANIKDDNRNWTIRAQIREPGESWEETAIGRINRRKKLIPLTVQQTSGSKRKYKEMIEPLSGSFSKAELISLGVPVHESSGTEMETVCKGRPYVYVIRFDKPTRSVVAEHNFGK
jgi:hypothetical protein